MRSLVFFLLAALLPACASTSAPSPANPLAGAVTSRWCMPDAPCWPSPAEWQRLGASLTGKLSQPRSPLERCRTDAHGAACAADIARLKSPYAIQDDPGATESAGWLGAWESQPSAYAVEAQNAHDVALAVDFAREHRLRLVVKGTGHDYLGRSNAARSLLVWTHAMRRVETRDAFVAQGCSSAPQAAVSVEAGARWLEVYDEATRHGRYAQGGGCTSVGAAGGFLQGGGFGSWSNKFGVAAASLLEAEVVTADGQLRVANACQNPDLFWALRGGGGGTFGVVTKVTLATYPAPATLGFVLGRIEAKSDAAYQELLERFVHFYREKLMSEHWGEHVVVRSDNALELTMSFQDLTTEQAEASWRPFLDALRSDPRFDVKAHAIAVPGTKMWSFDFLDQGAHGAVTTDGQTLASGAKRYWWSSNQGEVFTFWNAYQSRWIPLRLFEGDAAKTLASALFDASRHWSLEVFFNKGQAGATPEAIARDKQTSMNPAVLDAGALVISASTGDGGIGVAGHEPDRVQGAKEKAEVSAAMDVIRRLTPGAGAYVNEADYFEPEWQTTFWGANYERLLAIKRRVDPTGMFTCHHCVGSEEK